MSADIKPGRIEESQDIPSQTSRKETPITAIESAAANIAGMFLREHKENGVIFGNYGQITLLPKRN